MKKRHEHELSKQGLALRLFRFVVLRPIFAFVLTLVLVAAVTLGPDRTELAAFYAFTFPLLLVLILLVNAPFVGAAIRKFTLSDAVKMNHALEHGTIHFLRRRYGRRFKIGGRALEDGFRINGLNSPEHIAAAFNELREHLARGDARPVVSRRCASNIVSAQGFAGLLLITSAIGILLLGLDRGAASLVLFGNFVIYLILRYPVGNVVQRHCFVSVRFADAAIHSINEVKRDSVIERRSVFLVRTLVRPLAVGSKKPDARMKATTASATGSASGSNQAGARSG